jgi:hypothetical protein
MDWRFIVPDAHIRHQQQENRWAAWVVGMSFVRHRTWTPKSH